MFKIPTKEDIEYQLPKKGIFNERFSQWVAARWPVDRDDTLNNDIPNKYAAYYWFQNYPLYYLHYIFNPFSLQNGLILKLVKILFDNDRTHLRSHHDKFAGVKTHENSLFLYKST